MEHEHCTDGNISEVRIHLEDVLFHGIIAFLTGKPWRLRARRKDDSLMGIEKCHSCDRESYSRYFSEHLKGVWTLKLYSVSFLFDGWEVGSKHNTEVV